MSSSYSGGSQQYSYGPTFGRDIHKDAAEDTAAAEKTGRKFNRLLSRIAKLGRVTHWIWAVTASGSGRVRHYVQLIMDELLEDEELSISLVATRVSKPDPEIARLIARDCPECAEHVSYWTIISQYGKSYGKAVAIGFLVGPYDEDWAPRGLLVIVCREARR